MQLPAGAISMFGPGTNSLLAESLKKRHPSTSEDSVKSEEVSIQLIPYLLSTSVSFSLISLIFHTSDFYFLIH